MLKSEALQQSQMPLQAWLLAAEAHPHHQSSRPSLTKIFRYLCQKQFWQELIAAGAQPQKAQHHGS